MGYPYASNSASYDGLVELFLSSQGTVTLEAATFAATPGDYDNLGSALTIGDYDGTGGVEVGISAYGRDINGASSAGAVYLYTH